MTSDFHLRGSAENESDFEAQSPPANATHVSFKSAASETEREKKDSEVSEDDLLH